MHMPRGLVISWSKYSVRFDGHDSASGETIIRIDLNQSLLIRRSTFALLYIIYCINYSIFQIRVYDSLLMKFADQDHLVELQNVR